MRSRRSLVAVALALALAAGGAAWALAQKAREPFVLLTVVATSVGAPAAPALNRAPGDATARPPAVPLLSRVGRLVVAVREEAFLHTVGARLSAPIRLPAAIRVESGEVEVARLDPDGSVEIAAVGRELRLPPGAAASVLFAGGAAPVWADSGGERWREALLAALAEAAPVHVWRIENRGWTARAALARLPGLAAEDAAGIGVAEESR